MKTPHLVLMLVLALTALVYAPMLSALPTYEDVIPTFWQGWQLGVIRGLSATTLNLQTLQSLALAHGWQIGLHLLNGLLIAALLERYGLSRAVFAAAVYLLHPLAVESVAPLAYRADLLLSTVILLTLVSTRSAWGLLLVPCGLMAAVYVKESGVVAMPLLLLWLWITCHRAWRPVAWIVGPAAVIGSARMAELYLPRLSTWTAPAAHGGFWFVAVQAAAVWRYLALTIWPMGLSIDHAFDGVGQGTALLALLTLGIVLLVTVLWRRRAPALTFGAGWVAVSLAPHFLIPLPDYLKEHHWGLPLAGLCLAGGLTGVSRG